MDNHYDEDSQGAVNAKVLTKLDLILERQKDMEERIRQLERWRYYTMGICAGLMWAVNHFFGK